MELERGICNMCLESTRVLKPPKVDVFSDLLPDLFDDRFLTVKEYDQIKMLIKLCAVCCYKIRLAQDGKRAIDATKATVIEYEEICHFCKTDQNLIVTKDDWKFFNDRTQGLLTFTDFPLSVCFRCLHFFDMLYTVRKNFITKFPQLGVLLDKKSPRSTPKSPKTSKPPLIPPSSAGSTHHTKVEKVATKPKRKLEKRVRRKEKDRKHRKSKSRSPTDSKRKTVNNCFARLQPLVKSTYAMSSGVKEDLKMFKAITYVNLSKVKIDVKSESAENKSHVPSSDKQTPKERPIIKIKLSGKKHHKEKKSVKDKEVKHSLDETPVKPVIKTKASLKRICSSDEVPRQPKKALKRNSLNLDQVEEDDPLPLLKWRKKTVEKSETIAEESEENAAAAAEKIEDTPKAASSQELVPKRRVSLFVDEEEVEEISSESPPLPCEPPGDLNEIMQGFIKDSTFNENDKLDLLDEIEKNVEESSEIKSIIEDNGLKESEYATINGDHDVTKSNGDNEKDLINDPYFGAVLEEDAKTIDSGGSDSGSPSKFSLKLNPDDRECLDGGEKKKKRVTFSADVIN